MTIAYKIFKRSVWVNITGRSSVINFEYSDILHVRFVRPVSVCTGGIEDCVRFPEGQMSESERTERPSCACYTSVQAKQRNVITLVMKSCKGHFHHDCRLGSLYCLICMTECKSKGDSENRGFTTITETKKRARVNEAIWFKGLNNSKKIK